MNEYCKKEYYYNYIALNYTSCVCNNDTRSGNLLLKKYIIKIGYSPWGFYMVFFRENKKLKFRGGSLPTKIVYDFIDGNGNVTIIRNIKQSKAKSIIIYTNGSYEEHDKKLYEKW